MDKDQTDVWMVKLGRFIPDVEKIERGQFIYDHNHILNFSEFLEEKTTLFNEIAIKKEIQITQKTR